MKCETRTCFPLLQVTVISNCAADSAVSRASVVEYDVTLNCGDSQFWAEVKAIKAKTANTRRNIL